MIDSDFQALSSVGSDQSPKPATVASAATIAVTTFLTFVSGNTAIAIVTPPVSGHHALVLVFTHATPVAFTTTGNIKAVATPTTNLPVILTYNPIEGKYYAGVLKAS